MCATMDFTALVYDCLYVLILILNSFWFLLFFPGLGVRFEFPILFAFEHVLYYVCEISESSFVNEYLGGAAALVFVGCAEISESHFQLGQETNIFKFLTYS